jgi:hypothetical protein
MNTVIEQFWNIISTAEFERLNDIMMENAVITFPNTRELFRNTQKYVEFNKQYPGRWFTEIERVHEIENIIITTVKVTAPDLGVSAYVTSYFELQNQKISSITEYWGDNGNPPEWRIESNLTEIY